MEKKFMCSSPKDHYTADACIVWCFDDRFTNALTIFAANQCFWHYDLIKVAGGANIFADNQSDEARQTFLAQIQASIDLHHTKRLVLMNHIDCGASGGSKAFHFDVNNEKQANLRQLSQAKTYLTARGISIPITCVFVDFDSICEVMQGG